MTTTKSVLTLTPAGPTDEPFLRAVYASTRAQELALLDWDEAVKEAFVSMQFNAQRRSYLADFPDAATQLILLGGQPVGRLVVARRAREIWLIDLALLPRYRNAGIGTQDPCPRRLQ